MSLSNSVFSPVDLKTKLLNKHSITKSEIDIDGYRNRKEVIDEVAKQIEKDLNLKEPIILSNDPNFAYEELMTLLIPVVSKLMLHHHKAFLNALYRIDINEEKLKREIETSLQEKEVEVICRLIIERELIKVVYRLMYSKQNRK